MFGTKKSDWVGKLKKKNQKDSIYEFVLLTWQEERLRTICSLLIGPSLSTAPAEGKKNTANIMSQSKHFSMEQPFLVLLFVLCHIFPLESVASTKFSFLSSLFELTVVCFLAWTYLEFHYTLDLILPRSKVFSGREARGSTADWNAQISCSWAPGAEIAPSSFQMTCRKSLPSNNS